MTDAPIKQPEFEPQPVELSTPHFDEIAVLIAQPVEPIAPRRDWSAVLDKPWMIIAIVVIGGLLGASAVALTLPRRNQPPEHLEQPSTTSRSPEVSTPPETPMGSRLEEDVLPARRPRVRKIRPRTVVVPDKPVARRVGVIHYGASDRP